MPQLCLPGTGVDLSERVEHAVALLREHEPKEGYYFGFSGGKDSCAVDKLLQLAGVRYRKHYANVTIDPPELVRFIKEHHPDAIWNQPEHGNMFVRIATRPGMPPTRMARWCCDEYKENHGRGTVKVFGVRQQESPKRKHNWREVTRDQTGDKAVCPIVFWSGETLLPPGMEPPVDPSLVMRVGDVWDFIDEYAVP